MSHNTDYYSLSDRAGSPVKCTGVLTFEGTAIFFLYGDVRGSSLGVTRCKTKNAVPLYVLTPKPLLKYTEDIFFVIAI